MILLSKLTGRTLLSLVSTAGILFCLNGLLRIAGYENHEFVWGWANEAKEKYDYMDKKMFLMDPELIYKPNQNVRQRGDDPVVFDAQGFRPTGIRLTDGDPVSILMIGDSFTYGHSLNDHETLPYQLELLLRNKTFAVNIYNAGVPGYGSDQELLYLKKHILPSFNPDVVIWNINLNDAEDNDTSCLFQRTNDTFTQVPGWHNTLYIQGWLLKQLPKFISRSALGNLVLYSISPGEKKLTIGCTRNLSYENLMDAEQSDKLAFLLDEYKQLSNQYSFKPYISLTISQYFLDKQFPNNDRWLSVYTRLTTVLSESGLPFFNTNLTLVPRVDPELTLQRVAIEPEIAFNNILGAATPGAKLSLSILFIDEGPNALGHWHPTGIGNMKIAESMSDYLIMTQTDQTTR